jgi:hypothetical protein
MFIFALTVRFGAATLWQQQCNANGSALRFGDSNSYWIIARNLLHHGNYQYGSDQSRIFRAPIYPLFLTPTVATESLNTSNNNSTLLAPINPNSALAARACGSLLGAACIPLLMLWAYFLQSHIPNQTQPPQPHQSSRPTSLYKPLIAATSAGILASLYCGAVGMSIFILSEAVATPLFILSIYTWWLATFHPKHSTKPLLPLCIAAITLALACLSRPSWGLWPAFALPFLGFASFSKETPNRKIVPKNTLFFLALFILTLSPWWLRNYSISGKFVPTTLQVGASLYDGWHRGASGSSDENMGFSTEFLNLQLQEDAMLASQGTEPESTLEWRIDRKLRNAALQWAFENPSDVAKLGLVKFLKTWMPLPVAKELGNQSVRWWEATSYSLILALAVLGLVSLWKSQPLSALWIALPCLYLATLHCIFIGSVRYRQPGVLILCALAGVGAATLLAYLQKTFLKTSSKNQTLSNPIECHTDRRHSTLLTDVSAINPQSEPTQPTHPTWVRTPRMAPTARSRHRDGVLRRIRSR